MANLVTSEKILPLIEPVLDNSNIIKIKDTSKILEYRIESDNSCLLYTSPSPRDLSTYRMPSSA